jgi:anti-sigma B factor antagonist
MDMHTETRQDALIVTGFSRLTADNVALFRDLVRATLTQQHQRVEVDLAAVTVIDSDGVGAIIAVHKTIRERGGGVRLLNPQPQILQLVQLLRLDRILEIQV